MANEGTPQAGGQPSGTGATRPGWPAFMDGCASRVAGKPFATLAVEGTYVVLIPDTSGPADATLLCADEAIMRKLLKGELNPYIASMRRQARLAGDRGFGTRVMLGLQVESPFAADVDKGGLS